MKSPSGFCRLPDDFTALRTSSSWESPRLFSTVKSLESSSSMRATAAFAFGFFAAPGAQDIDLFKFFQPIAEFFKPQGTEIAGINQVAVPRGPVAEVRLLKRIAVPGIVGPPQKTVQMVGGGKEGQPFRLREGERQ